MVPTCLLNVRSTEYIVYCMGAVKKFQGLFIGVVAWYERLVGSHPLDANIEQAWIC